MPACPSKRSDPSKSPAKIPNSVFHFRRRRRKHIRIALSTMPRGRKKQTYGGSTPVAGPVVVPAIVPQHQTNVAVAANNLTAAAGAAAMAEAVRAINLAHRKPNTAAAYDPKSLEWNEFCDALYSEHPVAFRYTVDSEKLFRFIGYHAFRNKRQGGKSQPGRVSFDPLEFKSKEQELLQHITARKENPEYVFPDPEHPLGADAINTYVSTVRSIWSEQREKGANNHSWDAIRGDLRVVHMVNMVKGRKARIKRARFDEKLDRDFQPFQSMDQFPIAEQWLWDYGKGTRQQCFVGLRSRMAFSWCYHAVLRQESLFLGELSDLFSFVLRRDDHSDPMEVVILQMRTGKTVGRCNDSPQYGRAIRNKKVLECPVGALAFYLFYRFAYSGEMSDSCRPDFSENKAWFDVKLLSDGSLNHSKCMKPRTFTDVIKKCFAECHIFASWVGHWGRHCANAKMETMDVPDVQQMRMGKWLYCLCFCLQY